MIIPAVWAFGPPTTGIWCDRCLTPGIVETPVYLLSELGVQLWRTDRQCSTCDRPGR